MKKRLLVCGGRDFADRELLEAGMRRAIKDLGAKSAADLLVIHGGARGADRIAGEIARRAGVEVLVFPAEWEKYGKRAGFLRNRRMLDEGKPDMVLAAPGGVGTAGMVKIATEAGVPVLRL